MVIQEEKAFFETLKKAGITDFNRDSVKVLEYGFKGKSIDKVHLETNNLLQKSLKTNSLGECIHITGKMRALTDPFHRYLCDQINKKNENVFKVVYNLPEKYSNNTIKIIEENLKSWNIKQKRNWIEELRTIYSIANRSVNLYSLDTSDKIQYSVFGNKYILFQGEHQESLDKSKEKHTWLLESEKLNEILTNKAEMLISKSNNINEGTYRVFTQKLNSYASKRFYKILENKKNVPLENLLNDEMAMDITESTQDIVDILRIMQFIKINNYNQASITEKGKDFFASI